MNLLVLFALELVNGWVGMVVRVRGIPLQMDQAVQ